MISGTYVKWRSKKKTAEETSATSVCVNAGVGQIQALLDVLEVVAALGFWLEQQDHRGLKFSLGFEAAQLHMSSGCRGLEVVWPSANEAEAQLGRFVSFFKITCNFLEGDRRLNKDMVVKLA